MTVERLDDVRLARSFVVHLAVASAICASGGSLAGEDGGTSASQWRPSVMSGVEKLCALPEQGNGDCLELSDAILVLGGEWVVAMIVHHYTATTPAAFLQSTPSIGM